MSRVIVCILVGAMFLASCATQPDRIAGRYVSPKTYSDYDCQQIDEELEAMKPRMNELYRVLKDKADNDELQSAMGIVLHPVFFLALEGGDGPQAGEYAKLRGHEQALRDEWKRQDCYEGKVKTADQIYREGIKRAKASE